MSVHLAWNPCSGSPEYVFTMLWNRCSPSNGIRVHDAPEYPGGPIRRAHGCVRCLLLVMCTHPFAKKALTRHLARSEGHEHYFGCNLTHRKVLASSHQYLMTEAPAVRQSHAARVYGRDNQTGDTQLSETYKCNAAEHLEVYRRPVWALHDEANTSSQDLNSHGCLPVNTRSSFFGGSQRCEDGCLHDQASPGTSQ